VNPAATALRWAQILVAQLRYSLVREMSFKASFLLWIIVEMVWFSAQLAFVDVVFGHVNSVAGWSRDQVVLLAGTNFLIQQLFQAFFMINCMNLPDLVRTGKLDFSIAQPANTQLLVSTRLFDPGALVNAAIGLAVCIHAAGKLHLTPSPAELFLFTAWGVLGVIIHYAVLLSLVSLSFWIVRSQGVVFGYHNLMQLARIPRDAFGGVTKIALTTVLPVLIVANVPCNTLLGRESPTMLLWAALVSLLALALSSLFFAAGLRRYSSASS